MIRHASRLLIVVFFCCFGASPLLAQVTRLPAVMPPSDAYPGQLVSHPDSAAELGPPLELVPPPSSPPGARPPGARDGVFQKVIFTETWLAWERNNGFGINNLDLRTVLAFPFPSRESPLIVTPGFGVRYLDGPTGVDLPPRIYDAYVQFRWMRQFTPRFGFDAAVTPGVYSDFQKSSDQSLRIFGHVAGVYTWTATTKFMVGAAYLDRTDIRAIPLGGLIWTPNDDVRFELTFPRPKISRRFYWGGACCQDVQDWLYLAGEMGGNTWTIEQAGTEDLFTYRDFRVMLGLERKAVEGLDAQFEIGYVFGRKLEFESGAPDVEPRSTVMLRGGLTY